jgi:integrase
MSGVRSMTGSESKARISPLPDSCRNIASLTISPPVKYFLGVLTPSFRTAWRRLTKAAGLVGLRFHDLRHHAITELAESQVSDQTIMAIAGHVSQKMLARYSQVRSEAKRQAVMALSAKPMGSTLKGRKGGLRHQPRHKRGGAEHASAGSD